MGAGNIVFLLSAVCCSGGDNTSKRDNLANSPCHAIYRNYSLLELIFKPVVVLLEDQRSETSCKSNIKATVLSIELVLYAFYLLIHSKLKRTFKEKSSVVIFFTVEQPRMINIIK